MYQSLRSDIKDKSLVSRLGAGQMQGVVKDRFSDKVTFESRPKENEGEKS